MKKIAFLFVTAALLAACTGNKPKQEDSKVEATETFEEQQIKANMSVQLDSLTACWLRLGKSPVIVNVEQKTVVLTEDEKLVKPDYLINPADIMDKLETLSFKYRAMAMMATDKTVSDLYEMIDVYSEPVSKLAAEVNDPAIFGLFENGVAVPDDVKSLYALEEENGRANYFWEAAATSTIEEFYILTKNQEKFLACFTDKDAEDITYRVILLLDAFKELSNYNYELRKIYRLLTPLEVIDAISVEQLRGELNQISQQIEQTRATLFL